MDWDAIEAELEAILHDVELLDLADIPKELLSGHVAQPKQAVEGVIIRKAKPHDADAARVLAKMGAAVAAAKIHQPVGGRGNGGVS